ncbi:MAG TPA: winged helix-turn-helix domain-containing protein [Burkholderiaceae bacterium]|nr:winged helix-turn-helix domain-containing protein [Burkholderiaceae bacterium]
MNHDAPPARIHIGSCTFDFARAELVNGRGEVVHLRPQALRVLEFLVAHADRVVTRDELMEAVWPGVVVTDDSLVQCIGDVRRALGDENRTLVQTVQRRGYRIEVTQGGEEKEVIANSETTERVGGAGSALKVLDADPTARVGPHGRRRLRLHYVIAAAAALVLAALVWLGAGGEAERLAAVPDSRGPFGDRVSLAVLALGADAAAGVSPVDASAFNAGESMQLSADLQRNIDLAVVFARSTTSGSAQVRETARRLGVRYLLEARARLLPTMVELTVRLVDGTNSHLVWADEKRISVEQLVVEREALLRRIAASTRASLRFEQGKSILAAPPRSLEVYALVASARGRVQRFDPDEYRAARNDLTRALQREPEHPAAWEALVALNATAATARMGGDGSENPRRTAIAQVDRAIALDPRSAAARLARSLMLVSTGHPAEALKDAEQGLQLAPGNPHGVVVLANALIANGRMEEALRQLDQVQPYFPVASPELDFVRAKALWGLDRFDDSLAAATRCLERAPQFVACRAMRAVASDSMGGWRRPART